jgi:hypothetical protein
LTNRRMRARMSGGVGGGGATPPPTRCVIFPGKTTAPIGRTGQNEADHCLDWRSTYLLPYIRNLASFVNVEQQWQLNAVK